MLFKLLKRDAFLFKCYIYYINQKAMDYKKKSLNQFNCEESYEEIDTRLATGWYVKTIGNNKKKKYKTKEVSFKISKIKSIDN